MPLADFAGVLRGDALAAAYARMDVFVFPSHTDTFGNVVLEALASGVPAIVTPDGGPRYIVREGETGYVSPDEGFTAAIASLMANPGKLAAMRIAARTMNDHVHIDDGAGLFMPQNALAIHKKSISWLHETIRNLRRENAGARLLVVTHHAPGAAFLGDRVGEIAPAYASELLQGFAEYPPAAWIHGHTHYRHESEVNGIKVVSAPRGYASLDRKAAPFRPGFLVL